MAKSGGIRVDEFGLGFPPKIKKLFRWKGTDFVLNSLPFGGYVKIFGENPNEQTEEGLTIGEGVSFGSVSKLRQVLVLLGGVIANFLLAWVLFAIVLMIGIESVDGFVQRGFFDALWHGLLTAGKITGLIVVSLFDLIKGLIFGGADLSGLVGPVGLVGIVGEVSAKGISYLLYFTALISLNLAVINLVPLPALDGGRTLIVVIEALRKKALSPKVFNFLNNVSFFLLILLMIWITVRDIDKLI